MGALAFVFSGQGSQAPGMGRALYQALPAVRAVFDRHEKIRPGTIDQCFTADAQTLSLTQNAQPCLYALSLALAESLMAQGVTPQMAAGFSLGEITALASAGVFRGDEGFRFVCKRAEIMQKEAEHSPGGMAAVLKLTPNEVETLCQEIGQVYPVNYNCPGQTVVAGETGALAELAKAVLPLGGRVLLLKVSGAFHSPLMDGAARAIEASLKSFTLSSPVLPVYANTTARPYPPRPESMIAKQVNHPVLWQETIEHMIEDGATDFIELGAGSTLCGLITKIDSGVHAMHIADEEGFGEAVRRYGAMSHDA